MAEPRQTPHPEIDELLGPLTSGLRKVLGDRLVGAYLFGSATRGDFDNESDIDVVVVTTEELSDDILEALQKMHTRIATIESPFATQMEVSYIPRTAMRRYEPPNVRHPRLDRGSGEPLYIMSHDADWVVQRHLIREHSSVLFGPSPQTLIDPVSPEDMRQAMRELLAEWLAPLVKSPPLVRTRGYQSFLVLSTCRILYTLDQGDVISKRAATLWAEEALDSRWKPLIEGAWIGRQDHEALPQPDDLSETWSFIGRAMEIARA